MRTAARMLIAGLLLAHALSLPRLAAAAAAASVPNAAVVYWQAFAALPTLEGDQKAAYDAAIKSTSGPVTVDLQPVVDRFSDALGQLHRAGKVAACDWNLDYDAGPAMRLPHLDKARTLGRAALLRARQRFDAGATDEAVADVVAALKLARDCGGSPVIISLLVDGALEAAASEVLAANLPSLSPRQLDDLAAAIAALPPPPSMAECVRFEGRTFGDWLERLVEADAAADQGRAVAAIRSLADGAEAGAAGAVRRELFDSLKHADAREMLRLMRADYAEASAFVDLPPAERRGRAAEWQTRLERLRASSRREDVLHGVVSDLLPAIGKALDRADRIEVRRGLLKLAIDAQRNGPDAIRAATIAPHGPVDFRKTDGGFELACRPVPAAEPEVLRVGAAR